MKIPFLVESALLTHGLISVSDEMLLSRWPFSLPVIVWIEGGKVCFGTMADYIPFRQRAAGLIRISRDNFAASVRDGIDGALTASGTMLLADFLGIPFVVTCGMGGASRKKGEPVCPDLPAIRDLNVTLIAASPKDVLDIGGTLAWLRKENIPVYGRTEATLSGYLVRGTVYTLDGIWTDKKPKPPLLLLNPIPEAKRLDDDGIVEKAVQAGIAAKAEKRSFHPAANRYFDEQSNGKTSVAQFEQLIDNARWADELARR